MVLFLVQYFVYTLYTSSRFHVPHYWIWTSKEDAKNCQNTSTASVTSVHYISLCQIFTQKSFACIELFFIHLYISVVLKGLDRAESSDIHGFVAHAWDVKCPSIRKMGASLWISDVIFFSSYPFFFMLHLWAVCQNSEMPLATLKAQIWIFLLLSIPQNTLGILLPQMKDMSTNRSQRVRRQAGRGGSGKSIT